MTPDEVIQTKGRKFPSTVYLKWEGLDTDSPWLGSLDDAEDGLEAGSDVYVAEFKLVKIRRGRLIPEFK